MKIFNDLTKWQHFRPQITGSLGFIPTLGNLHAGHISLIQQSLAHNDATLVSIFINPTQFNSPADFDLYPRTLEADIELLKQLGVDYCLTPDKQAMYPDQYQYQVMENNFSLILEGKHRPGHFTGVLTVVMKLFNLAQPTNAYFGDKDYQQLHLIKQMVAAFFMPIKIIACPTIREKSQLPLSSRNNRLSQNEKILAEQVARIFHTEPDINKIKNQLSQLDIQLDYLLDHEKNGEQHRLIAYSINHIRLIDHKKIVS